MDKKIIGHESVVLHMVNAIKLDKVSHAYIISGEKGMGKKFLADYFAKLLLCENPIADEKVADYLSLRPCGKCKSCLEADTKNNPDIIYLTHEKPKVIRVDEVREQVINKVDIYPYAGKYKIFIIDEAEKLNEEAQNALLKTIEEPPEYIIIFLLTDNKMRLLETVRSRCESIDIKPVDEGLIKEHLMEEFKVPDYVAENAARFSSGNIGRAERFAVNSSFNEMKDSVLNIMRNIDKNGMAEALAGVKAFTEYKDEIKDAIDIAILYFRDMLVLKATGDANRIIFRDEYSTLKEQAELRNYAVIERAIDVMERTKTRLDANVNFDTAMELMFMHLKDHS